MCTDTEEVRICISALETVNKGAIMPICRVWHVHTGEIFALKLLHTGYSFCLVNASNVYGRGLSYFFWNAFVIPMMALAAKLIPLSSYAGVSFVPK